MEHSVPILRDIEVLLKSKQEKFWMENIYHETSKIISNLCFLNYAGVLVFLNSCKSNIFRNVSQLRVIEFSSYQDRKTFDIRTFI